MANIQDTFTINRQHHMWSAQEKAARHTYRKVVDSRGHVWLYAVDCDYPAETVHHHNPTDAHSDGYGGATLTFALEDGTEYRAKGPWHSNSDALLAQTGIDIRNTYRTFGCVALRCRVTKSGEVYEGLIHVDAEPTLGTFNRIKDIAQGEADNRGHPIAYYSESRGGSASLWACPAGTNSRSWREWFEQGNGRA